MKKILVANRGEIASRIIRTCNQMEIQTVAVYSEADKELPFVQAADEAICIGKSPVAQSYLQMDNILAAANQFHVDAIHPGYGLLSENGTFAEKVEAQGFIFIGPNADTIHLMGDKISSREIMSRAGVPVVPGSEGNVENAEKASRVARSIGYPVMLKASGGGGGIGMVLCRNESQLQAAFRSVKARAKTNFRSDHIFIEKYIENARHIEVQIFGDRFGQYVHLFERDCSVQRRNQKVVEESRAPSLSIKQREQLYEIALLAAKAVQYKNAGTVEFIMDEEGNFYFLEMNTRLQVEHPVTEMITNLDLVEWQIRIARGEAIPLKQENIHAEGHGMEFRVYAEHPNSFLPSPGKLIKLQWGSGSLRIDSGYREGNEVTPFYDPLIAKCIIHGETRKECILRARDFFEQTTVEGIQTNIPLFLRVLENESFINGTHSTNLLEKMKE
ncbi:acetyl-CoA carboxylase biotin carboxylase subunit [Caldibacillus lycopersici]|uniref:biotin carboxylase n=1 Tax=Perspicuibacillus lycopersici TaxID=1325689 RepID=A0AAE3IQ91_9BACI|nr:acetyl-CoA carboxylase biotin carboxylase subunit [Perspicuibacillus lycopersici]MCU9612212.1 acetyl-CoA carboxylase biotin carboxylase subunit [Perspicuibacillus lycopersici]